MRRLPSPLAIDVLLLPVWAALGWAIGLLLDRVIHQLPRGRSLAERPSCEACGKPVALLGITGPGKCPACGTEIRFDRVEWILGALFLALAIFFGSGTSLLAYSVDTVMLITLSAIDLRHRFVYAIVLYPALIMALLLTPLLTGTSLLATVVGFLAGLGIFAAFYFIGRLIYRGVEPVGKGDIELGALMGAMVGFPRVVSALFLGSMVNAVFIIVFLVLRRRSRRDFVPYGPGLCLGVFATFFLNP